MNGKIVQFLIVVLFVLFVPSSFVAAETLQSGASPYLARLYFAIFSAILLVAAITVFFLHRKRKPEIDSWGIALLCSMLLFLRWMTLSLFWYKAGNLLPLISFEDDYVRMGYEMANGLVSGGQWPFSMGSATLYSIFIKLGDYTSRFTLAKHICIFNGYFLMPACLILMFLILVRLRMKIWAAFAVVVFLALAQFSYSFLINEGEAFNVKNSCFTWPFTTPSYATSRRFVSIGLSGGSDVPAIFLLLCSIFFGLVMPVRNWTIAVFGALYAIACLFDMGNFLYAPAIILLFNNKHRKAFGLVPGTFLSALVFLIAFLAVYSLQLTVNYMQSGDFFAFPYTHCMKIILRPFGVHGVSRSLFSGVGELFLTFNYYEGCADWIVRQNYIFYVAGAVGMLFMKPGRRRSLMVAMSVPLLLYFTDFQSIAFFGRIYFAQLCYPFGMCFAALAFAAQDRMPERLRGAFFALAVVNMLLITPIQYVCLELMPFGLNNFEYSKDIYVILVFVVPALTLAMVSYYWQREKHIPWFVLSYFILFYSGTAWAIGLILLFCIVREIARCIYRLKKYCRLKKIALTSVQS